MTTSETPVENLPDYSHANDTGGFDKLNVVVEEINDDVKSLKTEFVSSFFLYCFRKFKMLSEKWKIKKRGISFGIEKTGKVFNI